MFQRILFTLAFFLLIAAPVAYGQQSPEKVQPKVTQATGVEGGAQAKTDDLNRDKQEMISKLRDAKYQVIYLKYRQEKTQQYIAKAKQNIEDLESQKAEFDKLGTQLRPYLGTVVTQMEDFIKQDLPFLPEERARRIAALKTSLDNYDLPLSELFRRVFEEGLEIEAEYGKSVDAGVETTLNINDVETPVTIFRLGRVGMYYLSQDATQSGFYNKTTGKWEPLPEDMNLEIKLAIDIAGAKRTVELVNLPLGK